MARLQGYPWPGNVRELKNTIERAASLADSTELTVKDMMPTSQRTPAAAMPGGASAEQFVQDDIPFKEAKQQVVDAFEASYLKALLDERGRPEMHLHEEAREAGWTDEQLLEAIAYVSMESFTAMVNVAGEVPVDGSVEETRVLRAA